MGKVMFMRKGEVHTAPVGGLPLSSLVEGQVVMINENGSPIEYLVVNQGIPSNSSMYDESCNGTWLLRKDIYTKIVWSSESSSYSVSNVHGYLTSTFLGLFDDTVQSAIKQVKLPYVAGTGTSGAVYQGSNGLSTKVFLLSAYELGWSTSNDTYIPIDGACLEYFKGCEETDAKRIAYLNGAANSWWTRSPNRNAGNTVWYSTTSGANNSGFCTAELGARPCFILPSTMFVKLEPNDDGSVNLIA